MNRIRNCFSLLIAVLMLLNMSFLAPKAASAATYGPDDRLTDPTVSYDENGNLLDDGTTTYTYDTANRLVQTTTGSDSSAYTYDGRGNLVEISENGATIELVLNENTAYPAVLSEIQGATTRAYAYGLGGLHAHKHSGTIEYPLLDHQGTIRHLTDAAGTVTDSRYYNAWGETRHTTDNNGPTLGYTGEREMSDGTVYLRARAYQPRMGKMVQRDGIDPAFYGRGTQGHNRYSYVENNPVNYVDPSGHLVYTAEDNPVMPSNHPGGGISAISPRGRGGRGSVGVAPTGRGMGSPGMPNYAPRPTALPLNNPTTVPPLIFTPNREQPASIPTLPKPRINPSNSPLPGIPGDPTGDWLDDLIDKYGRGNGRFCAAQSQPPRKLLRDILNAREYAPESGQCLECAELAHERLMDSGYEAQIYKIRWPDEVEVYARNGMLISEVRELAEYGVEPHHYITVVNGRVYDALTGPKGMDFDSYYPRNFGHIESNAIIERVR